MCTFSVAETQDQTFSLWRQEMTYCLLTCHAKGGNLMYYNVTQLSRTQTVVKRLVLTVSVSRIWMENNFDTCGLSFLTCTFFWMFWLKTINTACTDQVNPDSDVSKESSGDEIHNTHICIIRIIYMYHLNKQVDKRLPSIMQKKTWFSHTLFVLSLQMGASITITQIREAFQLKIF